MVGKIFSRVSTHKGPIRWNLDLRKPHHMKDSEHETGLEEISVPFNEKYSRYENKNRKSRPTAILPEFIS